MVYSLSRFIVRAILHLVFGFQVEGRQHEPPAGPVIVVSNHLSDLDPLVVGASIQRRVAFMAKEELFLNPLVRWWITSCGAFPVRRGEPDRRAFKTALRILSKGGVLVMFPEGTRGRDRALRPPEPGAALLVLRTGATILPVAVMGTDEAMPRDAHRLRRARIKVRIGPSMQVIGAGGRSSRSRSQSEEIEAVGRLYMAEIARLLV